MAPSDEGHVAFPMEDVANWSPLQKLRTQYNPELPLALQQAGVEINVGSKTAAVDPNDLPAIQKAYPHIYGKPILALHASESAAAANATTAKPLNIGVVFHGPPSPGAHTVVAGIFDSLTKLNPGSTLLGFIDGLDGLCSNKTVPITAEVLQYYRNQGGQDLLGRTHEEHQLQAELTEAERTCLELKLDGLVLTGGSSTATLAAQFAEHFAKQGVATCVVSVPCTIGNDLKGPFIPVTLGFDTACRVYSELISNICTDALSAGKYYFFIRLMGRRSSHIALECALRTQANMVILGEEVFHSRLTLYDVTTKICDAICARSAEKGQHHGVIIFPEGLIEHIPDLHTLIAELNGLMREGVREARALQERLSPWARAVLLNLPEGVREEVLNHRDKDMSLRFSKIETEKLFLMLVEKEMDRRTKAGLYKGKKFNGIPYFFGYQARSALPSNFDCCYAQALGRTAARLVNANASGYTAVVSGLQGDISNWQPGGVPLTALMTVDRWLKSPGTASTAGVPVMNPAQMDTRGLAFLRLQQNKQAWLMEDLYRNPGPIQFEGPGADSRPVTLQLEGVDYFAKVAALEVEIEKVRDLVRPGCTPDILQAALNSMENAVDVITLLQEHRGPRA